MYFAIARRGRWPVRSPHCRARTSCWGCPAEGCRWPTRRERGRAVRRVPCASWAFRHPEPGWGHAPGVQVLSEDPIRSGVLHALVESVAAQERLEGGATEVRGDRPPPVLRNRVVILVDDGLATG